MSNLVDCSELFEMRLTSEGFCCTFNYNPKSTKYDLIRNFVFFKSSTFYADIKKEIETRATKIRTTGNLASFLGPHIVKSSFDFYFFSRR